MVLGLTPSLTLAPFGPNERMSAHLHGHRDDSVAPGAATSFAPDGRIPTLAASVPSFASVVVF